MFLPIRNNQSCILSNFKKLTKLNDKVQSLTVEKFNSFFVYYSYSQSPFYAMANILNLYFKNIQYKYDFQKEKQIAIYCMTILQLEMHGISEEKRKKLRKKRDVLKINIFLDDI